MKRCMLFFLCFLSLSSAFASGSVYSASVLDEVLKRAKQTPNAVVVFDIDDTLVQTYYRNLVIFRDFAKLPSVVAKYPEESKRLESIGGSNIRWGAINTIQGFGIANPDFAKEAEEYWTTRFFGNESCAFDPQVPGASDYLAKLQKTGAKIVYITGRPAPLMAECTRKSLESLGFPLDEKNSILIMKPDATLSDLTFKKAAFKVALAYGNVVGAFENEPANLNAYFDVYKNAVIVFLDIAHSLKADRPRPEALWIRDYTVIK